jgi:hypothetical protein
MTSIINKGTGSGGSRTNHNGKNFEEKTSLRNYIENNQNLKKFKDYKQVKIHKLNMLEKQIKIKIKNKIETETETITILQQKNFSNFLEIKYKIDPKCFFRRPDEAYIIETIDSITIKILEKKNQNGPGSVIEKLIGNYSDEYLGMIEASQIAEKTKKKINFEFAFCLNSWLEKELNKDCLKYKIWKKMFAKQNIKLFYGDSENYFNDIVEWINN